MNHILFYIEYMLMVKSQTNLFPLKYNSDTCRKCEYVYKTKFRCMIGYSLV